MRLLIVADRPSEAVEPLSRARRAASAFDGDAEIVLVVSDSDVVRRWAALVAPEARLVPVDPWSSASERLEAGLLLRPLPDQLIVVGRDPSFSPTEMCFLSMLLDLRRDLGAVTADDDQRCSIDAVLEGGGAFRPGLLVSAGGFVGDGRRSVQDRLAAVGTDVVVMPQADRPIRELSA